MDIHRIVVIISSKESRIVLRIGQMRDILGRLREHLRLAVSSGDFCDVRLHLSVLCDVCVHVDTLRKIAVQRGSNKIFAHSVACALDLGGRHSIRRYKVCKSVCVLWCVDGPLCGTGSHWECPSTVCLCSCSLWGRFMGSRLRLGRQVGQLAQIVERSGKGSRCRGDKGPVPPVLLA